MNIEILKSEEYKTILIKSFNIETCFENKVVFTEDWIKFFNENSGSTYHNDSLKTFQKTEFLFTIDELIIGVFNNEYVVSFNEGDFGFEFGGDTESNWVSNLFGWGREDEPIFQKICFEKFGIPIKEFDPYDAEIDDD